MHWHECTTMLLPIYWVLVSNKILFLYNKYAQTITQWIHFFSFDKNHSLNKTDAMACMHKQCF
jgi:hypothetical protein